MDEGWMFMMLMNECNDLLKMNLINGRCYCLRDYSAPRCLGPSGIATASGTNGGCMGSGCCRALDLP